MSTGSFPVVLKHMNACAVKDGRGVCTSILPVISSLLVARGADRIVIPTPHVRERRQVEAGIKCLPPERRSLITLADTDGKHLALVRDYLEPLRRKELKWPEDAFIGFVEDFLYEVVIATSSRAGVLSHSASVAREFISIIDPSVFHGEARFRLAELCRLVCSYEPAVIEHGLWTADTRRDLGASALEILRTAEYSTLVTASGRIGYLKHPLVALRHLGDKIRNLIRMPSVKPLLKLASTAADAAGASGLASATEESLGLVTEAHDGKFHPPFISIGPVILQLYHTAIREGLPGSTPPAGTIMLFETLCGGHASHSWLSVGEENKLLREERSGINRRKSDYYRARKALARFV